MLSNLSFLALNIFAIASFFSPSLRTIAYITGVSLWVFALVNSKIESGNLRFANPSLKLINQLLIALALAHLALKFVHGSSYFGMVKTLFVSYLPWFWFSSLLDCEERESKLLKRLALTGTVLSGIIYLQLFGIVVHSGHAYGVLAEPFTSSALILISFFITLRYIELKVDDKFKQRTYLLFALLQLSALLVLGQLSVWFGLVIGLVIYIIFSNRFKLRTLILSGLILLASFTLTYSLDHRVQNKVNRLTSIDKVLNNKHMQCRFELWEANLKSWSQNTLLGAGHAVQHDCGEHSLDHSSNIYIQNLVEGGLLKTIPWVLLLLAFAGALFVNFTGASLAYFSSYLALLLEGIFENWWGDIEVLGLFLLIMALALTPKSSLRA